MEEPRRNLWGGFGASNAAAGDPAATNLLFTDLSGFGCPLDLARKPPHRFSAALEDRFALLHKGLEGLLGVAAGRDVVVALRFEVDVVAQTHALGGQIVRLHPPQRQRRGPGEPGDDRRHLAAEAVVVEDRETRPSRWASAASNFPPRNDSSRAFAAPTNRGSDHGSAMSPATATFRNAVAKLADRAAKRRSHAHAQPIPAPAQAPLIAATVRRESRGAGG